VLAYENFVYYNLGKRTAVFTKHAIRRINERGANLEFIRRIVESSTQAAYFVSKSRIDCLCGSVDFTGVFWTVVFNKNSLVVLTVRQSNRMEVLGYEEVYGF
jgi:hypothetical protein